jgi:nucleoside diphosphate kinase
MKRNVFEKLGVKLNKYKFMEYPKESTRYYFYHPVDKKEFVSKHVIFLEKDFVFKISNERKMELKKV